MKISIQFTAAEKTAIRNFFVGIAFHTNNLASMLGNTKNLQNIDKVLSDVNKDLDKEIFELSLPETALTYALDMGGKMLAPIVNFIIGMLPLLSVLKNTLVPLIVMDDAASCALHSIIKAYSLSKEDTPVFDEHVCVHHYSNLYKIKLMDRVGFNKDEVDFAIGFWTNAYAKSNDISFEEAKTILDKVAARYQSNNE